MFERNAIKNVINFSRLGTSNHFDTLPQIAFLPDQDHVDVSCHAQLRHSLELDCGTMVYTVYSIFFIATVLVISYTYAINFITHWSLRNEAVMLN